MYNWPGRPNGYLASRIADGAWVGIPSLDKPPLLRSVLEDDTSEPRFIRTVPRVGYALIAPVEPLADDRLGESWHDHSRDAYRTIRLRLVEGMLSVEATRADGSTRAFDLPTRQRCRDSTLLLEPAWYVDSLVVTNMIGRDTLALGRAADGSLLVLETRAREMIVILTPFRETTAAWIRFPPADSLEYDTVRLR